MTKFALSIAIVMLLFAMSTPLGLMAETRITRDLITSDRQTKGMINTISVEEEKKFCSEILSQGGLGHKCVKEVKQALVFGLIMNPTLGLQCCRNVLDVDMANNKCFELLFGVQGKTDIVSLMEFCVQEVLGDLALGPASQLED